MPQLTISNYIEALNWYHCSVCGYDYNELQLSSKSINCPKCDGEYAYSWVADINNVFDQKEADRKLMLPYIFEEKYGEKL